jgi:bacillithiol biosynthesis cysteine-adding enzyme BshC
MIVHRVAYRKTGYFSNLVCDYLDRKPEVEPFYGNEPSMKGFEEQMRIKSSFDRANRKVLVDVLTAQYTGVEVSQATAVNTAALLQDNCFTITTGHQLNIFTGPLYFLYKIITVIKLTEQLKQEYPDKHFVPVYWMATEDHDYEEIQYFNFNANRISWDREVKGAVGRLSTSGAKQVLDKFQSLLNDSTHAESIKALFTGAYLEHQTLAEATRYLVNELFKTYGLVIIDGDDAALKTLFKPQLREELLNQTAYTSVRVTNKLLGNEYMVQVNPRPINLFYLKDGLRERIVTEAGDYGVKGTDLRFTEQEILAELDKHPERFSPNVIMRPLYQETILPNLCYVGGGGELAYWLQLKDYFERSSVPFPILLLRNSAVLVSNKQFRKMEKLGISVEAMFKKRRALIDSRIRALSNIPIDLSAQRKHLQHQFNSLKKLADQTDKSFTGAVNAQEKKQLNGLDKLEKRLLKAQKRKMAELVNRIELLHQELFPNDSLEERSRNFSSVYLQLGDATIPMLYEALQPLDTNFSVIVY